MSPLRTFAAVCAVVAAAEVSANAEIAATTTAMMAAEPAQQFALADQPVGYNAAIRVAEAYNCSSYIGLEYQAEDGAIYSTFCSQGLQGMIKCELDNCRMME